MGLFSGVGLGLLVLVKKTLKASAYHDILDNFMSLLGHILDTLKGRVLFFFSEICTGI